MRYVQKLVRNGNTTHVAILRPVLLHLGWLPGSAVVVEVLEDKSLRIRALTLEDSLPKKTQPARMDAAEAVAP